MSASSDPSSSTRPAGPRSGPADVSVDLVVAARKGDPAAFARMVEHWNPHLRPFVHHTLGGEGSTDRVLAAAYVRAYRALPRYRGERTPGLWLHRIAYLAATDELRRLARDPARRRARADARANPDPAPLDLFEQDRSPSGADDVFDTPRPDPPGPDTPAPDPAGAPAVEGGSDAGPAGGTDPGPSTGGSTDQVSGLLGPDGKPVPPRVPPPPARANTSVGSRSAPVLPSDVVAVPSVDSLAAGAGLSGAGLVRDDGTVGGPAGADETDPTVSGLPPGWRQLAPDQRALAVMVDLEGYSVGRVADTFDATPAVALDRLESARRVLIRGGAGRPASLGADEPDPAGRSPHDVLASIPVPAADQNFWTVLGSRLLAERESPAAPAMDPLARLEQIHPAEPGFKPRRRLRRNPKPEVSPAIESLASQADWVKPPRRWGPVFAVVGVLVVIAVLIAVAIRVGVSSRIPDGSVPAPALAPDVSSALATGPYRRVTASVTETDANGQATDSKYLLVISTDGSWVVSTSGTFDQTTYDVGSGEIRRVSTTGEGDTVDVLANEELGLSAGPPDPGPVPPPPLDELSSIPIILRGSGDTRAYRRTVGETALWSVTRDLDTGEGAGPETWQIRIRRSDNLPLDVERRHDGQLVRRIRFSGWTTTSATKAGTFAQRLPDNLVPSSTDHGFRTTQLASIPILGRGQAVTPGWLPEGFVLGAVTMRVEAPAGEPSTADGANPPDRAVASLAYQRGAERIVVTTRAAEASDAWVDPFQWKAPEDPVAAKGPTEKKLGDGRFNGMTVSTRTDGRGRAMLWGLSGDTVLTVAGDLTPTEAFRLASSLR